MGEFVDVGVTEEGIVVLLVELFDFGRSWRFILSGCVHTWTSRRVWDHVHRYLALDSEVPPFVSAGEDIVWEVRKMDLSK